MPIRLRDFTIQYADTGDGIPILLIHGFPFNSDLWQPQEAGLDNLARIIAPDLRGFGDSDPVKGAYSMDLLAQDCHDLLENLGVKEKIIIGGLSMGGYIAFAYYRMFPARVSGLVLAATRSGPDSSEARANRDRNAELVREDGLTPLVDAMLPKLMSPKTYQNNPKLVSSVHEMMLRNSVEGVIGALLGMRDRPDSTPLLANIHVPTLIIHGKDDQLIPPGEAEAMHQTIPNSQLHILPDAGHLVNMEQADEFNRILKEFMLNI